MHTPQGPFFVLTYVDLDEIPAKSMIPVFFPAPGTRENPRDLLSVPDQWRTPLSASACKCHRITGRSS